MTGAAAGPDQTDDDATSEEAATRWRPPDHEVPMPVAVRVVVVRTADVAVVLTGLAVHSTGLVFWVTVRTRPGVFATGALGDAVVGFGGGGSRMLVGVELADGTRVSTLRGESEDPDPSAPFLSVHDSRGVEDAAYQEYWLTPLPPAGPLSFVVVCPALGVAETRVELDAVPLLEAARDAVELWPWEPEDPSRWEPVAPDLPPGSWFAR